MTTTGEDHDALRECSGLYVLDALTPAERAGFEAHVAVCARCAGDVRMLRLAVEALTWSVAPIVPPVAIRHRILASVSARKSSAIVAWSAAAAAVALIVGLGTYSAQLRGRVRHVQTQIGVLSAPDVVHVQLAGEPAAPGAIAHALWSRSHGLLLTVSRLPPTPSGHTYQLWILAAGTAPISNRWVLEPDASGGATVMFTTPPDLPTPVALAVTIEAATGASAPTGAKYLVGSVD